MGRLKASCVDVMALRLELRLVLVEKRFANQLMVGDGGQASKPERGGGEGGDIEAGGASAALGAALGTALNTVCQANESGRTNQGYC